MGRGKPILYSHQSTLIDCSFDKAHEERVRVKGFGFKFGVELHPDEPRVILALDDFR